MLAVVCNELYRALNWNVSVRDVKNYFPFLLELDSVER